MNQKVSQNVSFRNIAFRQMSWDASLQWARELNTCQDLQHQPLIQHCFWSVAKKTFWEPSKGPIHARHVASIRSCWKTQIENQPNRQIWLWIPEDQIKMQESFLKQVTPQCTIKAFRHFYQMQHPLLRALPQLDLASQKASQLRNYSHVVRLALLWNQGGLYFDLDFFFVRSLDPILCKYRNQVASLETSEKILFALSAQDPELDTSIQQRQQVKNFVRFQRPSSWASIPDLSVDPLKDNPFKMQSKDLFQRSTWPISWQNVLAERFAFSFDTKEAKEVSNSIFQQIQQDQFQPKA